MFMLACIKTSKGLIKGFGARFESMHHIERGLEVVDRRLSTNNDSSRDLTNSHIDETNTSSNIADSCNDPKLQA